MQYSRRCFVGAVAATAVGLTTTSCVTRPRKVDVVGPVTPLEPPLVLKVQAPEPPSLLEQAKSALDAHASQITHHDRFGLVDFSLASREPRFHLVDLASGQIERSYLVAHGSGSDPEHTGLLQQFSNQPDSHATSRGAYLTAEPYVGKYGRSQRLIGLDPDNSMALHRAIVTHGAPYVDPGLIASKGKIGRSHGCFAFELHKVAEVIGLLGEGRMIYAGKAA